MVVSRSTARFPLATDATVLVLASKVMLSRSRQLILLMSRDVKHKSCSNSLKKKCRRCIPPRNPGGGGGKMFTEFVV